MLLLGFLYLLQVLVRRLAVDGLVVFAVNTAGLDDLLACLVADGTHRTLRADDLCAFYDGRLAFIIEAGNECFTYAQVHDCRLCIESRVSTERLCSRFHGFEFIRGVCAKRMLNAVTELREDGRRQVGRTLRDEINAYAFGTDQFDHLLHFLYQHLWCIGKEKVCLVEEEHHLRLVHVACFGQLLEELGEQPEDKSRVEHGVLEELHAVQYIDKSFACRVALNPVVYVEVRFAEEELAALVFEFEQGTLDSTERLRGHGAVVGHELFRVLRAVLEHGTQVLHVNEQQSAVIGDAEDDIQHALLHFGQA